MFILLTASSRGNNERTKGTTSPWALHLLPPFPREKAPEGDGKGRRELE